MRPADREDRQQKRPKCKAPERVGKRTALRRGHCERESNREEDCERPENHAGQPGWPPQRASLEEVIRAETDEPPERQSVEGKDCGTPGVSQDAMRCPTLGPRVRQMSDDHLDCYAGKISGLHDLVVAAGCGPQGPSQEVSALHDCNKVPISQGDGRCAVRVTNQIGVGEGSWNCDEAGPQEKGAEGKEEGEWKGASGHCGGLRGVLLCRAYQERREVLAALGKAIRALRLRLCSGLRQSEPTFMDDWVPAGQFDAFYVADMKQIHNGDEALFVKESQEGSAAYKEFAHQTAVLVKAHLGWLGTL